MANPAISRITFERPAREGDDYVLHARIDDRAVRCIATHRVLADCLGAAISAPGVDLVQAAAACRPTLEYAFRNKLLAGRFDDPGERGREPVVVLSHDTFLHWANCSGVDPPRR